MRVHVEGLVRWSSASSMPLYGCMTRRPACPTRVVFHSRSSLFKHVFPLASTMSCHILWQQAALYLTYTAHVSVSQTPANLKEPIPCSHKRHAAHMSLWTLRSAHTVSNVTRLASRFQCTFHQLTGLVTLSTELLTSGLNALHWTTVQAIRTYTVLLCIFGCEFVSQQSLDNHLDCVQYATTKVWHFRAHCHPLFGGLWDQYFIWTA